MHYLITGATGLVGRAFIQSLNPEKDKVTYFTHRKTDLPDFCQPIRSFTEIDSNMQFDVVLNLAGMPIDCLWSESNKTKLRDSRITLTSNLIDALKTLEKPPKLMLSASAVGVYGTGDDQDLIDEKSPVRNPSFASKLCTDWENTAKLAEDFGCTVMLLRIGVVLSAKGGMVKKVRLPYQFGMGGRIGSGEQILPWVHIDDMIGACQHLIKHPKAGIYNISAPCKTSQAEFNDQLGQLLQRPTFGNLPACVIKMIFGQMGEELLLSSCHASPQALISTNYEFKHPDLRKALQDCL